MAGAPHDLVDERPRRVQMRRALHHRNGILRDDVLRVGNLHPLDLASGRFDIGHIDDNRVRFTGREASKRRLHIELVRAGLRGRKPGIAKRLPCVVPSRDGAVGEHEREVGAFEIRELRDVLWIPGGDGDLELVAGEDLRGLDQPRGHQLLHVLGVG